VTSGEKAVRQRVLMFLRDHRARPGGGDRLTLENMYTEPGDEVLAAELARDMGLGPHQLDRCEVAMVRMFERLTFECIGRVMQVKVEAP